MNLYLSKFDSARSEVEVMCPACGTRDLVPMDGPLSFSTFWEVKCQCGATFGIVTEGMFRRLVDPTISQKRNPKTVFIDVTVKTRISATPMLTFGLGGVSLFRWRGWVDAETRQVVREA